MFKYGRVMDTAMICIVVDFFLCYYEVTEWFTNWSISIKADQHYHEVGYTRQSLYTHTQPKV